MENSVLSFSRVTAEFLQFCFDVVDVMIVSVETSYVLNDKIYGSVESMQLYKSVEFFSGIFRKKTDVREVKNRSFFKNTSL